MAPCLAGMPRSGLHVQLCGDAHLSNFGYCAAPDRRIVFDINDFDETLPGPFEWDVKRLVARFAVAGRGRGFHPAERHKINLTVVKQAEANIERARTKDSLRAFVKLTTIVDSERRFDSDPPLIVPIEEMATERQFLTVPHDF